MTEGSREQLLDRLRAWAEEQPELAALYLFGSQVAGSTHPGSDVDLAALAHPDLPRERLWRLEDQWGADWTRWEGPPVDLAVLNLAPVPFRFEVISHGQLIWVRSPLEMAEFESITRRRYWDLRPLLQRDWAAFAQQVVEDRDEVERRQYEAALAHVRAVHRRVKEASGGYSGEADR